MTHEPLTKRELFALELTAAAVREYTPSDVISHAGQRRDLQVVARDGLMMADVLLDLLSEPAAPNNPSPRSPGATE